MQYSTTTVLAYLAAAASTVSAQAGTTLKVSVGNGALAFSPNNLQNVQPGTAVEFTFFPKNHTVSQSSFTDPCHPLNGNAGFFSGFVPTPAPVGSTFTIIVNDTKPIWIYCGQPVLNHCQSGMTAAINAPTTGNTFAKFQALAANATLSTNLPSGPVGGVLVNKNANNSSSSSSSSSGSGSSGSTSTSSVETVITTSASSTISTLVTSGSSTYSTTYATNVAVTYTTEVPASTVTSGGSGSGSGSSSTTSTVPTGAANKMMAGAGAAGAAVLAAMALL